MARPQGIPSSIDSTNLADLLERILDKGIVIAGDIKIRLVEVELLTLQIRLVICSVDKAKEMGMDWWEPTRPLVPRRSRSTGGLPDQDRRAIGAPGIRHGRARPLILGCS